MGSALTSLPPEAGRCGGAETLGCLSFTANIVHLKLTQVMTVLLLYRLAVFCLFAGFAE